MSHSRLFSEVLRSLRIARECNELKISTAEGIERTEESEYRSARQAPRRREFLKYAGMGAAAVGLHGLTRSAFGKSSTAPRIAIVGGGLGGLVCADTLRKIGIAATIYEGRPDRVGGRCHSNPDDFPGQVAEFGGEMIDNGGKTMLGYATEFKLDVEDYLKEPGNICYDFGGTTHSNADVVDQFRVFVANAQPDLRSMSNNPTALSHTPADVALDSIDLATYLSQRAAGLPLIQSLLNVAYISEYGLECSQQSSLNLLQFIQLNRRSNFNPYGASDERYHITGGNDQVPRLIAARLPGPVLQGTFLTRLSRNASGKYVLEFRGASQPVTADAVVLAMPFSTLRNVVLDSSLGLPPEKTNAIQKLGYGAAGKNIVGFNGRPWAKYGSNGYLYSDRANVQNTWETNWTKAGATSILTDFFGGNRGIQLQTLGMPQTQVNCQACHGPGSPFTGGSFFNMDLSIVNGHVDRMLTDLDKVWPGAKAAASRQPDGSYVMCRAHWWVQPFSLGCYTNYLPGQFTTIAGIEPIPVGNLYFAGEHTNSFYAWQGFLEGAALSGIAAANTIAGDIKTGALQAR